MRAWLVLALVPACAWDAGEPFGELTGSLTARWTVPADRDAGDGWQRLASDVEVRVERAGWTAASMDVVPSATASVDFDPAHPPAGYSLCHGGHCHADDGRLVPYEDIAAELAGGAPPAPVATFAIGGLDLIAGADVALACGGPCPLPRGALARVQLGVERIELAGVARDRRVPARFEGERPWTAMIAPAALAVIGRVDIPVDRGEPLGVRLDVSLSPGAALLDGVRWETLAGTAGPIVVDDDSASLASITAALGETELGITSSRSD